MPIRVILTVCTTPSSNVLLFVPGLIGGPILLCLLAVVTSRTAMQLGDNWLIMQKRWPQYLEPCRSPYAEMAYRSIGGRARLSFCASKYGKLKFAGVYWCCSFNYYCCHLNTYRNIYRYPYMLPALYRVQMNITSEELTFIQAASYTTVTARQFSLGFGTIVFAYGGHPVFPTIQHDMAKPRHFGKAVILSYIVLFLLYSPVALSGYAVYGTSISDSVISSIQVGLNRNWLSTRLVK
ncbi:unnamed protein product [Haemonchus placei]|uniref:Aa_trans domain-containing protein n=1 Tax=Haemonchus placei TaxID=6290 RepID=A0A0N4WKZ2_HAEPC|nr:unnamed protein product [Haemonchus placei]